MNQITPGRPGGSPPPGNHPPIPSGPQGQVPQATAPVKRKPKTPMVVAAVLALALVVGGGFLAWSLLRGASYFVFLAISKSLF